MKVLNYTLAVELGKMYYSLFKITSFGANSLLANDYDLSRDKERDNDDVKHRAVQSWSRKWQEEGRGSSGEWEGPSQGVGWLRWAEHQTEAAASCVGIGKHFVRVEIHKFDTSNLLTGLTFTNFL